MCSQVIRSLAVSVAIALSACQPAGGDADEPAAATQTTRTYQCGDLAVTATFDGSGAVDLGYPGGPLTLAQTASASGSRFADSQGNEFWSKGADATLTLAGQPKRDCISSTAGG